MSVVDFNLRRDLCINNPSYEIQTFLFRKAMEEMANIQNLAKQALKVFRVPGGTPSKQNLDILKAMMEKITVEDVNLKDPSKDRRLSIPRTAPVTHVNILECPYFSMAVFIVKRGKSLPLHDHPGMYGLCKVLYGSVQVKIYDRLDSEGHDRTNGVSPNENEPQKFVFRGETMFNSEGGACMVTPSYGNYHSISTVNGTAAFIDILGPPYASDKGRDCIYYKECQPEKIGLENGESDVRYLVQVPCPTDFFCDSQAYRGPVVDLKTLIEDSDD